MATERAHVILLFCFVCFVRYLSLFEYNKNPKRKVNPIVKDECDFFLILIITNEFVKKTKKKQKTKIFIIIIID